MKIWHGCVVLVIANNVNISHHTLTYWLRAFYPEFEHNNSTSNVNLFQFLWKTAEDDRSAIQLSESCLLHYCFAWYDCITPCVLPICGMTDYLCVTLYSDQHNNHANIAFTIAQIINNLCTVVSADMVPNLHCFISINVRGYMRSRMFLKLL